MIVTGSDHINFMAALGQLFGHIIMPTTHTFIGGRGILIDDPKGFRVGRDISCHAKAP